MPASTTSTLRSVSSKHSKKNKVKGEAGLDEKEWENSSDINEGNNYASTTLLEKRKEMMQVQGSLEAKRGEFEEHVEKLKEKEKAILQQRNELTDNIISLDKYIKENERKTSQNLLKYKNERLARDQMEREYLRALKELKEKEEERVNKDLLLNKHYIKFQDYLNHVVEHRGEGDSIEEVQRILSRCTTLEDSNKEQSQRKRILEFKLKSQRDQLKQYKEMTADRILDFTSQVGSLQRALEDLHRHNANEKKTVDEERKTHLGSKTEFGVLIMACDNLYQRVLAGSKVNRSAQIDEGTRLLAHGTIPLTSVSVTQFTAMLASTGTCITDFQAVLHKYNKLPREKRIDVHARQEKKSMSVFTLQYEFVADSWMTSHHPPHNRQRTLLPQFL